MVDADLARHDGLSARMRNFFICYPPLFYPFSIFSPRLQAYSRPPERQADFLSPRICIKRLATQPLSRPNLCSHGCTTDPSFPGCLVRSVLSNKVGGFSPASSAQRPTLRFEARYADFMCFLPTPFSLLLAVLSCFFHPHQPFAFLLRPSESAVCISLFPVVVFRDQQTFCF